MKIERKFVITKYVFGNSGSSCMSDKSDDDADGLDLEAAKALLKRQKREIKEKNALIAETAAEKAEKDALIAEKDALIAETAAKTAALIAEKDAQLDYSRWLTLAEITETMQPSADVSKYSEACKSFNTLFNSFRPPPHRSTKVAGSARPAVTIGKGMLDTTFKDNAHGWPHDPTCSDTWEGLVGPQLDPVPGILQEDLIKMTVRGYCEGVSKRRTDHSGIVNNRFNFFGFGKQYAIIDLRQGICFMVLEIDGKPVTLKSLMEWDGEATAIMIIPANRTIAKESLFCVPDTSSSFYEIDADDPLVTEAAAVFSELMIMEIVHLSEYRIKIEGQCKRKMELAQQLRDLVKSNPGIKIPCPDFSGHSGKKMLVQRSPARKIMRPGMREAKDSQQQNELSNPSPFIFSQRGFNAWLNSVHSRDLWADWCTAYAALKRPDDVLVLLPSCFDVSSHPLCIFCQSNALIHNPERYDVDASLIEEAKNFIHQGADLDEETFDRILRLTEADQPLSWPMSACSGGCCAVV